MDVVLFIVRGKGRSHAILDSELAATLVAVEPEIEFRFASYSTGATTLRQLGHTVEDFGLPEDPDPWQLAISGLQLLAAVRPTVVVCHEEPIVVPMARALGLPTVYLTDWFPPMDSFAMRGVAYADRIIFMDDPALYDEPSYCAGRVEYVGRTTRDMSRAVTNRNEYRSRLGCHEKTFLVVVAPGGADMHSRIDGMKRLADPDVVASSLHQGNALKAQRSSQPWSMVPSICTPRTARFGS